MATGGFGAYLTVATPNELKKLLGGAAYLLTGLTHFTSIRPERGRQDDQTGFAWEGAFLVLAVGNGRQAGEATRSARSFRMMGSSTCASCRSCRTRSCLKRCATCFEEGSARFSAQSSAPEWLSSRSRPTPPSRSTWTASRSRARGFRFELLPQRLPSEAPFRLPVAHLTERWRTGRAVSAICRRQRGEERQLESHASILKLVCATVKKQRVF